MDITPETRHPISRLCLAQKRHGGADMDIWLLDALKILPVLPGSSNSYIQFSLNLQCGSNNQNNRYLFLLSLGNIKNESKLHLEYGEQSDFSHVS